MKNPTLNIAEGEKLEVRAISKMGRLGWRILLALLFIMALSFFLQLKKIKVDVLEVNSISKQYVVAQASFEFPDDEKTFFLQQQAIHDIGTIYRFNTKEVAKVSSEFEEGLIENQDWRKKMPQLSFERMYEYTESLEDFLSNSRFSDLRTIEKAREFEESSSYLFELPADKKGPNPVAMPTEYWDFLKQRVFSGVDDTEMVAFIVEFFKEKKWSFQQDFGLEKRIKQTVKESIPEQYVLVQAGSFILEPGEKITSKHVLQVQALKNALGEVKEEASLLSILGSISLSFIITLLTTIYLKIYHKSIFVSLRRLTLLTLISLLTLFLAKATEHLLLYEGYNLIEAIRFPLIVPFASLLLCVLLGARIALFSSIFLSVIISLSLSIEYDRFLVLNLIASMCTIMFARGLHRRKDIFEVCAKVWVCCVPVLFAFYLKESNFLEMTCIFDLVAAFVFMAATAIIVVGLLPLFESIFNIMTDMSLMEYMDPNNELLRRLSLEAPGTYQHSLVVGNIAEIVARAIGANGLFCRVATLYHDIGKLFNPHYFTENQLGGFNIHQLLTPLESAHVIIAHVAEGESLARKHHLPQGFIDVIREHHGTTLVYFFYCKQVEQMGGDPSKVNEKQFHYPGPKPRTKEAALIMIADTVEAASRSLDSATEEAVAEMVDRLISEKAEEGQFDESPLTFQELCIIKKTMTKTLLITRHLRIKYPSKGI